MESTNVEVKQLGKILQMDMEIEIEPYGKVSISIYANVDEENKTWQVLSFSEVVHDNSDYMKARAQAIKKAYPLLDKLYRKEGYTFVHEPIIKEKYQISI